MTDAAFDRRAAGREPRLAAWWATVDRWSFGAVIGLIVIGLVVGMAASAPLADRQGLPAFYFVIRQAAFAAIAVLAMITISMQNLRTVRRLATLGFFAAFVAIMLLPVLGTDFGKGATRWFSLGFTSVQPSEFLKPAFVGAMAWLMAGAMQPNGPPGRLVSFFVMFACCVLLALQPDFGQAGLLFVGWAAMWWVAGAPVWLVPALGALAGGAGLIAYNGSEHFARRIDGYLAEEINPRTQIGYATHAIQEGGWFGVGVGEGSVKNVLPDAHTDFIIAVAAEEYGVAMCLLIASLFLFVTLRTLARSLVESDAYARIGGVGMAVLFGLQAFINLGVATRLLPAKGMTLPFISYGGSSLVAAGIGMGLLLAFTRRRQDQARA